jgi:superfamily II DNA or RNA helicase
MIEIAYDDLNLTYDKVTIIPINNTDILIASKDIDTMDGLKKHFSFKVKGFQFMSAYKTGNWDGQIRLMKTNGILPKGLLCEVEKMLKEWEVDIEYFDIDVKPTLMDISNVRNIIKKELIEKTGMEPWEHQWEVVEEVLKHKRCIARSATSSGKSYMQAMTVKYLHHCAYASKTLLIVPKTDLVVQMERDFIEYGIDQKDIGLYFGKVKDTNRPITIGTWQSLQNIEDPEWFEQYDLVIADEVHLAGSGSKTSKKKRQSGGTKIKQILDMCTNAEWRFGFTGTMPDEKLDCFTIIGAIGPVVTEVKASDLMEEGKVSQLKIIVPFIDYDKGIVKAMTNRLLLEAGIDENTPKDEISSTAKFNAEKKFLEQYLPRIKYIGKLCNSFMDKDENVLLLVNTVDYGKQLVKALTHLCKTANMVTYIHGGVEVDERTDIRARIEKEQRCIVIATTSLFSTGISVKNLHGLIMTSMGKSKIAALQSIGRTLRLHDSKNCAKVIDLVDNLKYASKHAQERLQYYANEEFDINIIETKL